MSRIVSWSDTEIIMNGGNMSSSDNELATSSDMENGHSPPLQRKSSTVKKLTFQDANHHTSTLMCLNTLRKNGQFCDVTLELVGAREIRAHRAVLASSSRYLMELFALDETCPNSHFKLQNFVFKHFEVLVNYIYTGRLEIEEGDIKSVYKMAMRLKMQRAATACSNYLAENLNASNCIGIRSFASGFADASLTKTCDQYISDNIELVATSKDCTALPRIQVEIIGAEEVPTVEKDDNHVYNLVVDWIHEILDDQPNWECLTDHVNVLYLTSDNVLFDCKDLDNNELQNTEYIKDYQKLCKKRQLTPMKSKESLRRSTNISGIPRKIKLMSVEIDEKPYEPEWRILATNNICEKKHLCIAMLDNFLATISIHYRPKPVVIESNIEKTGPKSPESSPNLVHHNISRQMSLVLLAPMSVPRSGLGVAVMKDNIVVIGGFDRGECHQTVEQFDISLNKWFALPNMTYPRGRCNATSLNGKLYVCGGSNSRMELGSLECLNLIENKWSTLAEMEQTRTSAGLVSLHGKLYCIGGNSGQGGMKSCECYDPVSDTWTSIANLNLRRSEAGVCVLDGLIYAVGGCDSWNCLNSVEVYHPEEDVWMLLPPMTTSRRGVGVATLEGKLYVIGGSDGNTVQNTIEIYDPVLQSWTNGPMMCMPRVNVGVVTIGNRVFAVGGYNGKQFLDTVEYFDLELCEWYSYLPTETRRSSSLSSETSSDKN